MTMARVERVLWVACPAILFIVMFGHMTALEFNALGLLALGTLAAACSRERPSMQRWPLALPIGAWALWAACAVGWSAFPTISLHAWFDEMLYPLVAFWGFWLVGSRAERPQRIVFFNWLGCLLLAVISLRNWGHLQPPTADTGLLHFYNRVGHTSSLAVFAMPLFSGLMLRPRWRTVGVTGLVLCLFIGLATLNRFFWPAAGITLLVALFPLYRRHIMLAVLAIALVGAAGIGTLEVSARLRYGHNMPPPTAQDFKIGGHQIYVPKALAGIGDTLSSDTRPKVWAFYRAAGAQHAWRGVGFGKPLPGMAYRAEMPASLLQLEPQAPTHAHNLFLNTWLQTGFIGLALQTMLLLALVARFWRLRKMEPWVCAAGIALVAGMITKNTTDDFMWQTTILAFWSFAGLLLGSGERLAGR
ncbi:O-antigen ligase family protein [Paraburkholderia phosphatilytica]|uniref:O-antigen ligase family protein n=1 Tax=Paraburkholderia phosphatilytica TaxID=2282883 RepID=UPI000E47B549|nr:O-antigen ligase family protein [Paraburkholderia phosphatilytica]